MVHHVAPLGLFLMALLAGVPAQAQLPGIDCKTTYDCCVMEHGAAACVQTEESAARVVIEKGLEAAEAANAASAALDAAALATAIDGESVNSLLVNTAQHLARLLELEQVGGVPPGEPPDKRNHKHWWREIKTFVKNIRQKLKSCQSRKQLMASLKSATKHAPRTLEQVADIEARLLEAARMMDDAVEELISCR